MHYLKVANRLAKLLALAQVDAIQDTAKEAAWSRRWPIHGSASGHICTEDLVFLCHEMGIETGIDLKTLTLAASRLTAEAS